MSTRKHVMSTCKNVMSTRKHVMSTCKHVLRTMLLRVLWTQQLRAVLHQLLQREAAAVLQRAHPERGESVTPGGPPPQSTRGRGILKEVGSPPPDQLVVCRLPSRSRSCTSARGWASTRCTMWTTRTASVRRPAGSASSWRPGFILWFKEVRHSHTTPGDVEHPAWCVHEQSAKGILMQDLKPEPSDSVTLDL